MRGGAISFSTHRRCCIYFLLIHSDIFFYASKDRSMLIPFSLQKEGRGAALRQGLDEKYESSESGAGDFSTNR